MLAQSRNAPLHWLEMLSKSGQSHRWKILFWSDIEPSKRNPPKKMVMYTLLSNMSIYKVKCLISLPHLGKGL